MTPTPSHETAAGEIVGSLVLISIFVLAFAILAMVLFSLPALQKIPAVALSITNQSKIITISHESGDSIPISEVEVLVDGVRHAFTCTGCGDSWSIGETLSIDSSDQLNFPNRVDIVFLGPGTAQQLLTSMYLGTMTPTQTPVIIPTTPTPTITVTPTPVTAPVANFTGTPTSGSLPLLVSFMDTSTGTPTGWSWTFGDIGAGNTSTFRNPSHIYTTPGTYPVTLTVSNAGGSDTLIRTNYITVVSQLAANFTGTPASGNAPLTVEFTDTSTGTPTGWNWTFGDIGTGNTSTLQNPTHTYTNAGTYSVTLTIRDAGSNNTFTRTNYITVTLPTVPVANFTGTPAAGYRPLTVVFTDTSTNTPTTWSWNFGDLSSTNSTLQNPVHGYTTAGTYTVVLTATNAAGSNTLTRTNYIVVTNPPPTVTSITPDTGIAGTTVPITNLAGTNFVVGTTPTVQMTKGATTITATGVVVDSATRIHCTFVLPTPSTSSAGSWNVIVTNADGQVSAPLTNGFTIINPPPTVTGITPNGGAQGNTVSITNLAGTNFITGTTPVVTLTNGASTISATGVSVVSANRITCTFAIPATATLGTWNVVVQNADGQTGTGTSLFTVRSATHLITSFNAPPGLGNVYSPTMATEVLNGGTVTVADGTSQAFIVVPKSNKKISYYTIDSGAPVYPGTGTGVSVTYTFTNVIGDHTISVTFSN